MKETHPFLQLGKVPNANKLILGSFPVFSITLPESKEKLRIRNSDGTVQFFYGSCYSRFWGLYHLYIDNDLQIPIKPELAIKSLKKNSISISDLISECERNGKSALDKDLTKRVYNIKMLDEYLESGVTKILCTSKGVMEMFHEHFVKKSKTIIYQESESKKWQTQIISNLKGDELHIKKLICMQYLFKGKTIRLFSIPSPGSPQRQLKQFGFSGDDWRVYAEQYFEYSFKWFIEDLSMEHKTNCNCCDCIWQRLIENQEGIFQLVGGREVSYRIFGNTLEWITVETTHSVLYPQSRENICESITARINNLSPSNYPGTATSYKWALLNDNRIWLV